MAGRFGRFPVDFLQCRLRPASDAGPDGALKSALMIPDKAEDLRVMDEITIGCELAPAKSEGAAS
jgi:hypothetical protein